jgi:hypothetical protein
MVKEDEEKTSFITPFGTFCFVRMPEGLKNAGPTFTRMTMEVFKPQIGRNIQAYVDDLIVKSSDRVGHVSDLAKTFANMRRAGLKLNPEKCVFGVTKGKILGCLISVSYGPPWAHYLGGYQDRLLGGPLGLPGLRYTTPDGVEHKDYRGVVLS